MLYQHKLRPLTPHLTPTLLAGGHRGAKPRIRCTVTLEQKIFPKDDGFSLALSTRHILEHDACQRDRAQLCGGYLGLAELCC